MGDNGYSINDMPKVTSVSSTDSLSQTEAFDIMVRFLSRHQFRQQPPNSQVQLEEHQHQTQQHQQRVGHMYHFWEDLYHVAESLAIKRGPDNTAETDPQKVAALRNLRFDETTTSYNKVVDNGMTNAVKAESSQNDHSAEENLMEQKISKKIRKEKKKEKKRKRESHET
jgi:hypothetical protein